MRALILFLTLSSVAFADEPTISPIPAVNGVRNAYKVALRSQLEKSGEDEALGKCEAAKGSYTSANDELKRINAELAVPTNTALGQAQVDYRGRLETMKKVAEAKLAKAKTDAKMAGTELVAAEARVKAINTELARIEAEEKREKEINNPPTRDYTSGLDGLLGNTGYTSTYTPRPPIDPHTPSWVTNSSPSSPTLPEEFKGCYPDEAKSS